MKINIGNLRFAVDTLGVIGMIIGCLIVTGVFFIHLKNLKSVYGVREMRDQRRVVRNFLKGREELLQIRNSKSHLMEWYQFFLKLKVFKLDDNTRQMYADYIQKLDKYTKVNGTLFGTFNTYHEPGSGRRLSLEQERGRRMLPEDYFVQICLVQSVSAIILCLLGLIVNKLFFLALIFLPLIPEFLVMRPLRTEMKKEIVQIQNQFPTFVSMFYYRFKDPNSPVILESLIDDFLPIANKAMVRMLTTLRTDIEGIGDMQALEALTFRYLDSNYVIRFASIVEALLKKQHNAYMSLDYLHRELQMDREQYYRSQDKNNERKVQVAQQVLGIEAVASLLLFILFGTV